MKGREYTQGELYTLSLMSPHDVFIVSVTAIIIWSMTKPHFHHHHVHDDRHNHTNLVQGTVAVPIQYTFKY